MLLRHNTDTATVWAEYHTTKDTAVVTGFSYEIDFTVPEENERDHEADLIKLVQEHSGKEKVLILEGANVWE